MKDFWGRFLRRRSTAIGLGILAVVALVALFGPSRFPQGPFSMVARPFVPPSAEYFLGTDMLGRNVLAGIVYGARTSLKIALSATVLAIALGALIGALAGYYGGWLDEGLMRFTETFQTIPFFIFAILLVAVLTPSVGSVITAISVVSWAPMARLVRGEFMAMRNREFVQACVGVGMGDLQIMARQILPNCLPSIIVTGSLMVATAILIESALSFLGLSDPNVMSWGYMVGAGREFLQRAPWLCAIPGVAILVTVLAVNLVGDGLNDALNPRLRHS